VFSRFWGGEGNFNAHLTKERICEIFPLEITSDLVALNLSGIDPLKKYWCSLGGTRRNETGSDDDNRSR